MNKDKNKSKDKRDAELVKKIVAYLLRGATRFDYESGPSAIMAIAAEIEAGKWKD